MLSHKPSEANPFSAIRLRTVLQRCLNAEVKIGNDSCGKLDAGLLLLVGFSGDAIQHFAPDLEAMLTSSAEARREHLEPLFRRWWDKVLQLRIFSDSEGKMNQSLAQQPPHYGVYLVSQFTLFADLKKGHRPSYTNAIPGAAARLIFDDLINFVRCYCSERPVFSGVFAADMDVRLTNDGPVTLIFDCSLESGIVSL